MKRYLLNSTEHPCRGRRAAAVMEFAVCLPLILVLLVGTLEASSMIYLKQTLSIAAYEGARTAVTIAATDAEVQAACRNVLTGRNVADATISISPSPVDEQPIQTWITVTVSAPTDSNSVVQGWFLDYASRTVTAQATMMKEY